jgi:recombination protein RecT
MAEETKELTLTKTQRMSAAISSKAVQDAFGTALKQSSSIFLASVLDMYSNDNFLQKCEPGDVIRECMKAATMKLPINKSLGFAWIIPRKDKTGKFKPNFQIGWKGVVQLAQRTGIYRYINCGIVYDGMLKKHDILSGALDISGEKVSDVVVGFFAYIETINGFSKSSFWTVDDVTKHAIRYSEESKRAGKLAGNWKDQFENRAMSTVLKHLILKSGEMSIEHSREFDALSTSENDDFVTGMLTNANQEQLEEDTGNEGEELAPGETIDEGTGHVISEQTPPPPSGPSWGNEI